jgi:hypothetical protein
LKGGFLDLHPDASEDKLLKIKTKHGVYMILGDHPVHGDGALLYLGKAPKKSLEKRIGDHDHWVREEWRTAIYLGILDKKEDNGKLLADVESLLIYAHSPAYNRQKPRPKRNLRVWNTGRFHRLLPEVSSDHPWYRHVQALKRPKSRPKSSRRRRGGWR